MPGRHPSWIAAPTTRRWSPGPQLALGAGWHRGWFAGGRSTAQLGAIEGLGHDRAERPPPAGPSPLDLVAGGAAPGEEEFAGFVAERLTPCKRPGQVRWVDALPRSALGRCSSTSWHAEVRGG